MDIQDLETGFVTWAPSVEPLYEQFPAFHGGILLFVAGLWNESKSGAPSFVNLRPFPSIHTFILHSFP